MDTYLYKNHRSKYNKELRKLLHLTPTDFFDEETEKAVLRFQKKKGLMVDGIVGPITWKALITKDRKYVVLTEELIGHYVNLLTATYQRKYRKKVKQKLLDGLFYAFPYFPDSLKKIPNLCYILGQMREETGEGLYLVENLNYSPEGLRTNFKYYRIHKDEAYEDGYSYRHSANKEAIANKAYRNRNGNRLYMDGSKYKGRGGNGLTGRGNYLGFQNWLDKKGINIDVMEHPQLLESFSYWFLPVIYYYEEHKINKLITSPVINDITCDKITKVYNKYTGSYKQRVNHTFRIARKFKLKTRRYHV